MSLNIKPLDDRVVVEPLAADEKTASGIILPDTAQEKPQQGTVVVVGPGKACDKETCTCVTPMSVKKGDKVCLLYTSPSPRDQRGSRMPSSA